MDSISQQLISLNHITVLIIIGYRTIINELISSGVWHRTFRQIEHLFELYKWTLNILNFGTKLHSNGNKYGTYIKISITYLIV